jgi:hypothetical protein
MAFSQADLSRYCMSDCRRKSLRSEPIPIRFEDIGNRLKTFRFGEEPNTRVGMAMITSAPEALALHEKMARELWSSALKGPAAVQFMRAMME